MNRQVEEAFHELDRLIEQYRSGQTAGLTQLAPLAKRYGTFYTSLPLSKAFEWYDDRHKFARRRHVPPSDDELRHVFNIAQLMAVSPQLKLLSFDGDVTLYPNQGSLQVS